MKFPQMTGRGVLLLAIPFLAVILVAVSLVLREERPNTFERDREELEKLVKQRSEARVVNPVSALTNFRRARSRLDAKSSAEAIDPRAAKEEILKLGQAALPVLRTAIFDTAEKPLFRLELIALVGEMKGSAAEQVLLEIFSASTFEERYRTLALSKLSGHQSDPVFTALKKVLMEEPGYKNRHILVKVIGESRRAESKELLLDVARAREEGVSVRIQALDSMKPRINEPGVLDVVRTILHEHPEENVRISSIAALGKAQDPSVDSLLTEIANNSQMTPSVRKAASNWLEERRRR